MERRQAPKMSGPRPEGTGASVTRKAIVIGYGNPLRGDDAVGQLVVRAVSSLLAGEDIVDGRAEPSHDDKRLAIETLACHQLTPELAERLAGADLVVFIDAAAGAEPGSVMTSKLTAAATLSPLAHRADPHALLAMAGGLFGRAPRAFLIEVGAASFEFGEVLSPAVTAALPKAIAAVQDLLSSARNPTPHHPHRQAGFPPDTAPSRESSSSGTGRKREARPAPD